MSYRDVCLCECRQDHAAKEKALQTMSSMSSAQIVSAGSAIHNKMPPALVGPLALHASTPVSYPGAVSPRVQDRSEAHARLSFSLYLYHAHSLSAFSLFFSFFGSLRTFAANVEALLIISPFVRLLEKGFVEKYFKCIKLARAQEILK